MSLRAITGAEGQVVAWNKENIFKIPDEITIKIFMYLDIESLARIAQACKRLFSLTQETLLWKQLYIRDFCNSNPELVEPRKEWKKYCPDPAVSLYKKHWKSHYASVLHLRKLKELAKQRIPHITTLEIQKLQTTNR